MDEQIAEIIRKQDEREAAIKALIAKGARPIWFRWNAGGFLIVGRDASKPGRWRVTRLDEQNEPTGHTEAPDFERAVREALMQGADIASAEGA